MDDHKKVLLLAKKILDNKILKKVSKLGEKTDRAESLKYLIASKFKLRLLELEHALEKVDKKEAWVLEAKYKRLESKIAIFLSTYNEKDYLKVHDCLVDLEEELRRCLA